MRTPEASRVLPKYVRRGLRNIYIEPRLNPPVRSPERDVLLLVERTMISESLLHRMKVLVIDDDRLPVTLLEQLLQRHGYSRVLGITNPRAALETCAAF